jgi:hypothetical protein
MIRASLVTFAIFAATAFPQESSSLSDPQQIARVAEEFVNQRLALWQPRLGLENWKVSIVMSRRSEMKPSTLGGIHWDKKRKTAEVQVLDASEYRVPISDMLKDMEFTVVHELIHLELASLPRSEASRSDEEQAVNQMARALLKLERQAAPASQAAAPCQIDLLESYSVSPEPGFK